jgi:hypothetical protein
MWLVPSSKWKEGAKAERNGNPGRDLPLPLSQAALDVLAKQPKGDPESFVFGKITANQMNLRTFGFADYTRHGLRSTFRAFGHSRGFKDDVLESILSHGIARMQDGRRAKSHEAPYMKGVDYSGSARDVLDQWADFLTK